jgi:hypothetical protein
LGGGGIPHGMPSRSAENGKEDDQEKYYGKQSGKYGKEDLAPSHGGAFFHKSSFSSRAQGCARMHFLLLIISRSKKKVNSAPLAIGEKPWYNEKKRRRSL